MAPVAARPDIGSSALEADLSGHSFAVLRRGDYELFRGARDVAGRILLVVPAQSTPESRRPLEHELSLGPELDPSWAAEPVRLVRYDGRSGLALSDPGGEL